MREPVVLDTMMHGRERLAAVFLLSGTKNALVETGPKSSVENVLAALARLGVTELDYIIVTHIHLDHAGAAGTLARHFPDARVVVHPVGAPHLADPAKLWKSASRIYEDDMDRLWGGIDPIDQDRIDVIRDGEKVDLGGRVLEAVETPGHAWHHHAFLDHETRAVFTGDAVGVLIPGIDRLRPATPPPEFDFERALASIDKLRALEPDSLYLTHFGPVGRGSGNAVGTVLDRSVEALRDWHEWVTRAREQTHDLDTATEIVERHARQVLEVGLDPDAVAQLELTSSYRMNTWGFMRYLDKKAEAG